MKIAGACAYPSVGPCSVGSAAFRGEVLQKVVFLTELSYKNNMLSEVLQLLCCIFSQDIIKQKRFMGWSGAASESAGAEAAPLLRARCPQKRKELALRAASASVAGELATLRLVSRKAVMTPRKPQSPGARGSASALLAARGCRLAPLCRRPCVCPRVAAVVNNNDTPPQSARSERVKGGLGGRIARETFRKSVSSSGVDRSQAGDVSINAFDPSDTHRRRVGESPTPSFCPRCRQVLPRQGYLLRFSFYLTPENQPRVVSRCPCRPRGPATARGRTASETITPCTGSEPPC